MHNTPNGKSKGRFHLVLTEAERRELDRRAAALAARLERPVSVSEYIRMRTLSDDPQRAAA